MASKKTTAKRSSAKQKATSAPKKAPRKPAAKKAVKKAAPKKTAKKAPVKKSPAKKAAPKKKVVKKAAPKKAAPVKKASAKKVAPKKADTKVAPQKGGSKQESSKAAVVVPAVRPPYKRPPRKKKPVINDPLTPRPKKKTPQNFEVLRPGRKKARKQMLKPKSYRAMTPKQRERYRVALLEMRERISGQISSLKKESLTRVDEVNVEEDGTDAFDRQFALNLASSENEALIEIDAALKRIEERTFGKCDECGGGIETPRLKAIPFARNCISCQSDVEKHRPGYRPPLRID